MSLPTFMIVESDSPEFLKRKLKNLPPARAEGFQDNFGCKNRALGWVSRGTLTGKWRLRLIQRRPQP